MTKPIFILNGPNLNRLGKREPEIYGTTTLAEVEAMCREAAGARPVRFHQSNIEGEIVNWILDALKMFPGPIIELHISNIHKREAYYHNSFVSKIATAVMAGFGPGGYGFAVRAMEDFIAK
jgi:3-dehydroquinate dehydratase II